MYGLTQLECTKDNIGVSLPPSRNFAESISTGGDIEAFLRSRLPRGTLVPYPHTERYDLAWLLATIAIERHDENRRMHLGARYYDADQDPHRRYIAFYYGVPKKMEQSRKSNSQPNPDTIWSTSKKSPGSCAVHFLPESKQDLDGMPPGSLVSTTTVEDGFGGVAVHGEFHLDAVSHHFSLVIYSHATTTATLRPAILERAMERVEIAIAKYVHTPHFKSPPISPDCLPVPDAILNETKATSLLETQHMLLGHSGESQEAQFIGMIKGPLESIMSPIMNPLGGVMTSTIMDAATPISGGSLHDNLKYMHEQITASLIVSLTAKVPEIIGNIVPYEISSEMAAALRNRLTQFFLTDDMLPRNRNCGH